MAQLGRALRSGRRGRGPFPTLDRGLAWTAFAIPEAKRGKFRYYRFHRQSWYGQIREIQLFGRPSAPGTCLFVR